MRERTCVRTVWIGTLAACTTLGAMQDVGGAAPAGSDKQMLQAAARFPGASCSSGEWMCVADSTIHDVMTTLSNSTA